MTAVDTSGGLGQGDLLLGKYRVLDRIGTGGFGTVYRVFHERLNRTFAIKMLNLVVADDPAVLVRFQREAETAASLRHPNIVEVFDWETLPGGTPSMIMEYLEGEDLSQRLARGPMDWPSIGRIGGQVLAALEAAHASGVVHRDLKPHNIFLASQSDGSELVKLLDFGLAKAAGAVTITATAGSMMGSPCYMSPEQAEGRIDEAGPHSDLFSFGAVLYEMVTGQRAFGAANIPATIMRVIAGKYTPPKQLRPDTPKSVSNLIAELLQVKRGNRLGRAREARTRLAAAVEELAASQSSTVNIADQPPTPKAHRWGLRIAIGIALGSLGAAGLWAASRDAPAGDRPSLSAEAPPVLAAPSADRQKAAVVQQVAAPAAGQPTGDVPAPRPAGATTGAQGTVAEDTAEEDAAAAAPSPTAAAEGSATSPVEPSPRVSKKAADEDISAKEVMDLYYEVGRLAGELESKRPGAAPALTEKYLQLVPSALVASPEARRKAQATLRRLRRHLRRELR